MPTFKIRPALLALCALLLSYAAIWWLNPRRPDTAAPATPSIPSHKTAAATAADTQHAFGADLEKILAAPTGPRRFAEFHSTLVNWTEQNPEAALAFVRPLKPGEEYDDALLVVLPAIAKSNAERAVRVAGEMAKTAPQRVVYAVLFDEVATNDLQNAVRLLDSVSDANGKHYGLRAVAATWATKDLDGAIAWAKGLGANDRNEAIELILEPLSKQDPARALELAKEYLTGATLLQAASTSLIRLSAEDATSAAEAMTTLPHGIFQTPAALEVTRALAADSPDSVLNFLTNFPTADERRLALNNVLDIWAVSRPQDAARYVSSMSEGTEQNQAAAHLAQRLALNDPDEAIEFATSLNSSPARDAALLYTASGWARHDPPAAAEWCVTIPADTTTRSEAINAALSFWVVEDPKAAAEWLKSLAPADQLIAMRTVAPAFAQKDPENAIEWATNLPPGHSRDAAVRNVLDRWTQSQPAQASRWAQAHKVSFSPR